jgi:hypothetical protein
MGTRNLKNIFNKRSLSPCLFSHGADTPSVGMELEELSCRGPVLPVVLFKSAWKRSSCQGEIASKLAKNHCQLTIKFFDVNLCNAEISSLFSANDAENKVLFSENTLNLIYVYTST